MRDRDKALFLRACRKFIVAGAGSAAVEYAAILTMVVGLSYVAYSLLGSQVGQALSQVAQHTPAGGAAKDKGQERSDEAAAGNRDSAPPSSASTWLPATALLVTLLAAGALIFDRRRRANALVDLREDGVPASLQANFVEKRQQILRMLTGHTRQRPGESVTVRHLMTTKLTTIVPSVTVEEIGRLMHDARIHHLLVVCGERELVGIVSDRDVAHRSGRAAADIMTRNPLTVTPETPAIQAISMMLGGRFSCVPVVEGDMLVGLLTTTDVMMALQCTLQILSQSLQSLLADGALEIKGVRYFARLLEGGEEDNVAEAANA